MRTRHQQPLQYFLNFKSFVPFIAFIQGKNHTQSLYQQEHRQIQYELLNIHQK